MKPTADTYFGLCFKPSGNASERHGLPVGVLIRALNGLQRSIHLVAMMNQGYKIKARIKIPKDIERHFHLFCQVPQDKGFCQPTIVAAKTNPNLIVDKVKEAVQILREIMNAVSENNADRFKSVVTDPAFQHHLIVSLRMMIDEPIDNCTLNVEDRNGALLFDRTSAIEALRNFEVSNAAPLDLEVRSEIIGRVERIDFGKRILFLRIMENGNLLESGYDDKFEKFFIKSRNSLIKIRGDIEIDNIENKFRIIEIHEMFQCEGEQV